jgi:hypothetical protein
MNGLNREVRVRSTGQMTTIPTVWNEAEDGGQPRRLERGRSEANSVTIDGRGERTRERERERQRASRGAPLTRIAVLARRTPVAERPSLRSCVRFDDSHRDRRQSLIVAAHRARRRTRADRIAPLEARSRGYPRIPAGGRIRDRSHVIVIRVVRRAKELIQAAGSLELVSGVVRSREAWHAVRRDGAVIGRGRRMRESVSRIGVPSRLTPVAGARAQARAVLVAVGD